MSSTAAFGVIALLISVIALTWSAFQVYKGKHRPHAFSMLVWFIVTAVAFFNLLEQGAGPAAWRLGYICCMMLVLFVLCTRQGLGYVTRFDLFTLASALTAIPIWVMMDDPELALFWVTGVEFVGMLPTMRKAWVLPREMNPYIQLATATALLLQILALERYTPALLLYLGLCSFMFYLVAAILLMRRAREYKS